MTSEPASTHTATPAALPIVRSLARLVLPGLLATRLTPNQITAASAALGLGACACYLSANTAWNLFGAVLLIGCYVLDNCDGDVARAKGLCSRFGALFDTVVDSLVHVALFAALGVGLAVSRDDSLWLWVGACAALGAAINSALAIAAELRDEHVPGAPADADRPDSLGEWLLFALRELGRADFCFLLAAATLAGIHHWLLAASAIGAHVYWMSAFHKAARRFHV